MPSLVKIGLVDLEKMIFFISSMYFSLFRNYLPLEKGGALHLNKLESPSPKDTLCQVWLKLAQWFWIRRFLNFVNVFSLFHNYHPLKMGGALHFNKLESPSPDALCQVWSKRTAKLALLLIKYMKFRIVQFLLHEYLEKSPNFIYIPNIHCL